MQRAIVEGEADIIAGRTRIYSPRILDELTQEVLSENSADGDDCTGSMQHRPFTSD